MGFKNLGITGLLATMSLLQSGIVHSQSCITVGASRLEAANKTVEQCGTTANDCDQYQGKWYCSSDNLNSIGIVNWLQQSANINESIRTPATSQASTCVDSDGDGWGWNGVASCKTSQDQPNLNQQLACVDHDGDGWGWNGVASCKTGQDQPNLNQQLACVDSDGDGWGWDGNGSCETLSTSNPFAQSIAPLAQATVPTNGNLHPIETDSSCIGQYGPSDITDVILVTGQSNVTASETEVAADFDQWGKAIAFYPPDQPHQRVFAWTVDSRDNNNGTGWKVAALNQSWHDSSPGVGGLVRNNFAFHFAKKVAIGGSCRVVGIIMVAEGGRGISHWDNGATGWLEVNRHVTEAVSALGRTTIDGVLWHQGESDWIIDGTCFTGSTCRTNLPDYYPQKLYSRIANPSIANPVGNQALIDRMRRSNWFGANKPFIAAETVKAPLNIHLNKLNSDGDKWTASVQGSAASGLSVRGDDPDQNHYSAEGLRELGSRYATAYFEMTGR